MLLRVLSHGWAAVLTVLSFGAWVSRVSLGSVGRADEIRSVQSPAWWEQLLASFLSIPAWVTFVAFIASALVLAIQLAIDAHKASEALTTIKTSNERAWAFEPEFRVAVEGWSEQKEAFQKAAAQMAEAAAMFDRKTAELTAQNEKAQAEMEARFEKTAAELSAKISAHVDYTSELFGTMELSSIGHAKEWAGTESGIVEQRLEAESKSIHARLDKIQRVIDAKS